MTTRSDCPHCGEKNTITKAKLLNLKASPTCKTCDKNLLPYFDKPLTRISPKSFIHKLDSQMLAALQKIPGIQSVLKVFLRHSFELALRLHHQGNFVQVSKKQITSLHKKLEHAAKILDIKNLPELYVYQDPRAQAYTFGVDTCSIAISSGCLEIMTEQEILGVLAHELGHIKAHHVLYKTASKILSSIAENIAQMTLGLGGMVLYPIQMALLRWDRASELSSDRAALLVVKNPKVILNMLMKLACGSHSLQKELNIKEFISQAESYEKTQEEGPLGKYIAVMNNIFTTHPFPIWRAREILDWVYSGEYTSILAGNFNEEKLLTIKTCPDCKKTYEAKYDFCPNCDPNKNQKFSPTDPIDKTIKNIRSWYEKNFGDIDKVN